MQALKESIRDGHEVIEIEDNGEELGEEKQIDLSVQV